MENNPYLLQEAVVVNSGADLTTDVNRINEDDDNMNI